MSYDSAEMGDEGRNVNYRVAAGDRIIDQPQVLYTGVSLSVNRIKYQPKLHVNSNVNSQVTTDLENVLLHQKMYDSFIHIVVKDVYHMTSTLLAY